MTNKTAYKTGVWFFTHRSFENQFNTTKLFKVACQKNETATILSNKNCWQKLFSKFVRDGIEIAVPSLNFII